LGHLIPVKVDRTALEKKRDCEGDFFCDDAGGEIVEGFDPRVEDWEDPEEEEDD
jgi:hypothetical protein